MGGSHQVASLGTNCRAKAVTAGSIHTCAILAHDGSIKCWGDNSWGQLGELLGRLGQLVTGMGVCTLSRLFSHLKRFKPPSLLNLPPNITPH